MKNKELTWLIIGIVLVIVFSGFGMMSPFFGGYGGMMYGGYGSSSIFGWIYGILITIVLVLLIVWLFRQLQKR